MFKRAKKLRHWCRWQGIPINHVETDENNIAKYTIMRYNKEIVILVKETGDVRYTFMRDGEIDYVVNNQEKAIEALIDLIRRLEANYGRNY